MSLRFLVVTLLVRMVERTAAAITTIQMFLYGLLPALLPPKELTRLVGRYYDKNYGRLNSGFQPGGYSWTLEPWEEQVLARHMTARQPVIVLGAGLGRESIALARRGYRVIGLDNNRDGLRLAAARADEQGIVVTFVQADFYRLPLEPSQAGYLLISGVMYSAIPGRAQRQDCLRRFREAVHPGGLIFMNFHRSHDGHNGVSPFVQRINRWLRRLPGSNRNYQPGDYCTQGHFMHLFLDETELRSELTEAGAAVLELNWHESFVVLA